MAVKVVYNIDDHDHILALLVGRLFLVSIEAGSAH